MRILHTADWHIGRVLHGRKRYEEFSAFLDWLVETIQEHNVDVVLVAGDVFDTTTPSNHAQELYYSFLYRVAGSVCRHVVVTAGNHDSPSFLTAPRALLRALHIHVVGSSSPDPDDEVLVLRDEDEMPELIVCAVPYLRDRDIRLAEAGESIEDKERKLIEGIRAHYAAVGACAERKRKELGAVPPHTGRSERNSAQSLRDIPIVGMGHLFTAGGKTLEGDGVRELYVGSLAHVTPAIFPDCFDYLALGHLHVPQKVGGLETIRYSGSPVPMGFGEAGQPKSVCLLTFTPAGAGDTPDRGEPAAPAPDRTLEVQLITVPSFQRLERIRGNWNDIALRITEYAAEGSAAWLEVIYEGDELISDLRERLETATAGTRLEVLRVKNTRVIERVLGRMNEEETLEELNVDDVFERCLSSQGVPEEQLPGLRQAYRETLSSLHEEDGRAE